MHRCAGFALVGNALDSAATYLSAQTALGEAFLAAVQANRPMLFLGNDAKLAGDTAVGQTEVSTTAAYRGRLTRVAGLDLLGSTMIMPRAFQNPDYHENRLSGLFWGMAKSQTALGILLDAGTQLRLVEGEAEIFGNTPVIFIAARRAQWVDFSTYRASGSLGPRQSAALDQAELHIVPHGHRFDFVGGAVVNIAEQKEAAPPSFQLEQNYPNPFNPQTTIRYHLARADKVSLRVFDLQGREIGVLVDAEQKAGDHAVRFNAEALASGVYLYCLRAGAQTVVRKMTVIR